MIVAGRGLNCQCERLAGEMNWVEGIWSGLLSVHLLAMNLASAGPLFAIWLWGMDKNRDSQRQQTGLRLIWLSIGALLLGAVLGYVQWLLLRQSGWAAAIAKLPTRALWFGLLELLFSLLCMVGCVWCWRANKSRRWLHAFLAVLTGSNLLYHFPPLMTVLSRVSRDPSWARAEVLDRATLLSLMKRPEVLALTSHFLLASIAVAAVTVLGLQSRAAADKATSPEARRIQRGSAWWAFAATLGQVPVGVWLISVLPQDEISSMMGESMIASLGLIGGLLLTFVFLQRLLTIAIGEVQQQDLRKTVWILLLLVFVMTLTLKGTRLTRGDEVGAAKQPWSFETPRL